MRPMTSKPEGNIPDVVDGAQGLSWGPAGALVLSRRQCKLLFSSHAWHSPRRPASEEACVDTEAKEPFLLSKIQPLGTAHSEPKISLIKYDQSKTMGAIHSSCKVLPAWLENREDVLLLYWDQKKSSISIATHFDAIVCFHFTLEIILI